MKMYSFVIYSLGISCISSCAGTEICLLAEAISGLPHDPPPSLLKEGNVTPLLVVGVRICVSSMWKADAITLVSYHIGPSWTGNRLCDDRVRG